MEGGGKRRSRDKESLDSDSAGDDKANCAPSGSPRDVTRIKSARSRSLKLARREREGERGASLSSRSWRKPNGRICNRLARRNRREDEMKSSDRSTPPTGKAVRGRYGKGERQRRTAAPAPRSRSLRLRARIARFEVVSYDRARGKCQLRTSFTLQGPRDLLSQALLSLSSCLELDVKRRPTKGKTHRAEEQKEHPLGLSMGGEDTRIEWKLIRSPLPRRAGSLS